MHCASAGILKLHHGNVVRNIHIASSLLLPQNWTISAKTVVLTALGAAVNMWHISARKLLWKWHSYMSEKRKRCMGMSPHVAYVLHKSSTETISAVLYVSSKNRVLKEEDFTSPRQ